MMSWAVCPHYPTWHTLTSWEDGRLQIRAWGSDWESINRIMRNFIAWIVSMKVPKNMAFKIEYIKSNHHGIIGIPVQILNAQHTEITVRYGKVEVDQVGNNNLCIPPWSTGYWVKWANSNDRYSEIRCCLPASADAQSTRHMNGSENFHLNTNEGGASSCLHVQRRWLIPPKLQ